MNVIMCRGCQKTSLTRWLERVIVFEPYHCGYVLLPVVLENRFRHDIKNFSYRTRQENVQNLHRCATWMLMCLLQLSVELLEIKEKNEWRNNLVLYKQTSNLEMRLRFFLNRTSMKQWLLANLWYAITGVIWTFVVLFCSWHATWLIINVIKTW